MMGYKAKEHSLETFTMSAENPDFMKRVEVFVDVCDQLLAKDILNWNYKMRQEGYTESIEVTQGKKYIKLIRNENGARSSLFGWIDMSNGDVLMGHNYRSPSESEKRNPRSNIWNGQYGTDCVSHYGVGYKGQKFNNYGYVLASVDNVENGTTIKELNKD
tara:strand:- start:588 stop:1067 length:480 start_codon:yes stop_codon:yes gene_type:complete